jgi:tetratricopeptide (TPR) repeat protein
MRIAVLVFVLLSLPALAQPRPGGRAAEFDALFAGLKAAPSEETAAKIEGRLRQLWSQAIAPSAVLLLNRATRELGNDAAAEALEDVEAAIVIDPEAPEGYHRRATVRAALGNFPAALADLQETLRREPRYYPALQSLSRIAEQREDHKGALSAWEKVLELNPKHPDGQERLKALTRKALGEEM